jgi:hypothetical protein
MDEQSCPICLDNFSTSVTICKNKHKSCIMCIRQWILNSDTCPVCRSTMVISGKYDQQKHKLQHRFSDTSPWENYNEADSDRIISHINLSIKGGSCSLQIREHGPSFNIYWGDHVSNCILTSQFLNVFDRNGETMYDEQKRELKKWKDNHNKYGFEEGIIVQRNKAHTGMRLVRIKQYHNGN